MDPIIRDEVLDDRPAIREITLAAFGRPAEADLIECLMRDSDVALSLVAVDAAGTVVGHLLLSRLHAPFRAVALAPLAVVPSRQRTGIGSRLVVAGLARAEAAGWEGVVVLGDPSFYGRFGFDPALAAGLQSPFAGPYLMMRALIPNLGRPTGPIAFAPAFSHLPEA